MPKTKISYEDKKEIIRLRKEGRSFPAIGRQFGLDHTTVVYHCQREGIPTTFQSRGLCTKEGCERKFHSRGLCEYHYNQNRYQGTREYEKSQNKEENYFSGPRKRVGVAYALIAAKQSNTEFVRDAVGHIVAVNRKEETLQEFVARRTMSNTS